MVYRRGCCWCCCCSWCCRRRRYSLSRRSHSAPHTRPCTARSCRVRLPRSECHRDEHTPAPGNRSPCALLLSPVVLPPPLPPPLLLLLLLLLPAPPPAKFSSDCASSRETQNRHSMVGAWCSRRSCFCASRRRVKPICAQGHAGSEHLKRRPTASAPCAASSARMCAANCASSVCKNSASQWLHRYRRFVHTRGRRPLRSSANCPYSDAPYECAYCGDGGGSGSGGSGVARLGPGAAAMTAAAAAAPAAAAGLV